MKLLKKLPPNPLPDLPSKLVAVARRDLVKTLKDKRYRVCMEIWHGPDGVGHCAVCNAGCVMAQTLKVAREVKGSIQEAAPSGFDDDTRNKLRALDQLRRGHVDWFLFTFSHLVDSPCVSTPYVAFDPENPKPYIAWLKAVEIALKEAGL